MTSDMLDIEFLRDAAPRLRNHVVYVYHSGSAALRRRVWDRVNKLAESAGVIPTNDPSASLATQIIANSFFEILNLPRSQESPRYGESGH